MVDRRAGGGEQPVAGTRPTADLAGGAGDGCNTTGRRGRGGRPATPMQGRGAAGEAIVGGRSAEDLCGVREEIGAGGLLHAYLDRPGGERRGDLGRCPTEERWRRRVGLQERVALARDRGGGGV